VRDFLLISSDKAAEPVSLMGAAKRVAERLVAAAAPAKGAWVSVRFGNVLGSSGSVLQVFRRRLAAGLSLEVRDPRATRHFMTVEEAGQLLVLAAGVARRGDLLLLQVGDPLRIEELATRLMVESAGATGGPGIRLTRLLPGERLLDSPSGGLDVEPTGVGGIARAAEPGLAVAQLDERLERLRDACAARDRSRVVELVRALAR
jgi:FlaA1/EpsC-like NDP-sugar epimerase